MLHLTGRPVAPVSLAPRLMFSQPPPAVFCCDVCAYSKQRHLVLRPMIIHLPPPCRIEFLSWIQEWRIWRKEHHQHPLAGSKFFPNDIYTVETSLSLRDKIYVKSFQEHQEFLDVLWAKSVICVLTPFSDSAAHGDIAPAVAWHIHHESVAYYILASCTNTRL